MQLTPSTRCQAAITSSHTHTTCRLVHLLDWGIAQAAPLYGHEHSVVEGLSAVPEGMW